MSQAAYQLSIVIPAYNEAARIGPTLQALERYFDQLLNCEFVIVDDGSEDGTVQSVGSASKSNSVHVICLEGNQGKGAATRTGVLEAKGATVFVVDADLPYQLDAFDKALESLEAGADMVIGARDHPDSEIDPSYPRYRSVAGKVFSRIVNWQVPVRIFDTQCGFKAFRGDVAKNLFDPLKTERFAHDIELLLRARLAGYRIERIPVKLARQHGSRVRLFRDSLQMLRDLRKIRRMYLAGELDPAGGRAKATKPEERRLKAW
jgi:dolichyl-phosphate beta-glucosyltransferase